MGERSFLGLVVGSLLVGAVTAACGASSAGPQPGVECTAGNFVFCRCEDRSEGTKLCHADGLAFDDCKCDGTGGPVTPDPGVTDGGGIDSSPLESVDSGGPVMGPTIDVKCINKLGVVAGGASPNNDIYVATYAAGGTFSVSKSTGAGVRGAVTVLPFDGSLIATYLSRYGYLAWTKLTTGTWSVPESLGDGTADPTKRTTMTLFDNELRAFYLGQDAHYHIGNYSPTSGWDIALTAGALAERPGDAGTPLPRGTGPAVLAIGDFMTLAFTGTGGALAFETYWTGSSSWSFPKGFATNPAYAAPPALVALDPGGAKDALMVYAGQDLLMHVVTRDATTLAWDSAALFDTAASSTELALAALPDGNAMLVYMAAGGAGYYSVWKPGTGFAPPTELVPGKNPLLGSVPSVTRGQCGSDATIAIAQKDGFVKLLRYSAGTMSAPFDVGGIVAATYAGVGEMP